ncbi:hypothetical protein LC087_00285 [Bacillus carboniphilus]|uniref:Uncharacterized protein n=1 Tax=Bacillus carboniphilus TaxID=86663 RepID=A0ABY9JTJ7_9BACI|nr:hypothetical protein [Bacillus carboniphilus]WLR42726.1 hypothetical protein LC087_00285 [Bacillus carboniphilus]
MKRFSLIFGLFLIFSSVAGALNMFQIIYKEMKDNQEMYGENVDFWQYFYTFNGMSVFVYILLFGVMFLITHSFLKNQEKKISLLESISSSLAKQPHLIEKQEKKQGEEIKKEEKSEKEDNPQKFEQSKPSESYYWNG